MAVKLSATAKILSQKGNVEPNLILEIDGITTVFTTIITLKAAKYGEDSLVYGQAGLVYGGGIEIEDSKNYITLDGSGPTITQQLKQDKGGVQSVSSLNLELIDQDGEISRIISPGITLDEIIGVKARIYLNFKNGRHPNDSLLIHRGIIDQVQTHPASININVAHPEAQKRQELFIKTSVKLDGAIDDIQTTITVTTTVGFILQALPELRTYFQVDEEIIEYTGISGNDFTGCVRGSLGTIASAQGDGDSVNSFYRLTDNAMDLALKLMLSSGDEFFATGLEINNIGALSPTDIRPAYLLFKNFDIQEQYGLVAGDIISISGSAANDGLATCAGFGRLITGESFIITTSTFSAELSTTGTASFKSKYRVLTEGMGMTPQDVDVAEHELLNVRFNSQIPDYDFYIKETITGKEFISNEIYFAAGLYTLPRKAKASVGITIPPLSDQIVPILDGDTVTNPASIRTQRGINANFYNAVVIRYEELPLEEKFIQGQVTFSSSSQNRIKNVRNRPLTIESKGLRDTGATSVILRNTSRRLLDRYEFAAESIPGLKMLYKTGFNIDVGDVAIFGSPELKAVDLETGTRNTPPKLYEVVNKSLNIKTGEVRVNLLSTAFELDGRYGVFSPASLTDVGSTTTSLIIKDSFSTTAPVLEREKWANYINEKILVHTPDRSFAEITEFKGFSASNDYRMIIDPPLSVPPPADYIIDIPDYPDTTDKSENDLYKLIHCSVTPQIPVVSGASATVFDVGAGDVGKMFVGSLLRVHTLDFVDDSAEVAVVDITVNTITVDPAIDFVPDNTHFLDLVGFIDEGLPYRYI